MTAQLLHRARVLVLSAILIALGAQTSLAQTSPAQTSPVESRPPASSSAQLADKLLPLIENHEGRVAVSVLHLKTGDRFDYRSTAVMPTASLIKLPRRVPDLALPSRQPGTAAGHTGLRLDTEPLCGFPQFVSLGMAAVVRTTAQWRVGSSLNQSYGPDRLTPHRLIPTAV